ncbi:MAG: indole-3-glycerol phosphate synthase TrpC [Planctomycetes bacterium]|nr:indole-3-glycerol phosphate synthase TrpC [Planctomycetota bacterium]
MNILRTIVEAKKREVAERSRKRSLTALRASPAPPLRSFSAALRTPGISAIAEIKRRSPSRGVLRENIDPAAIARQYERAGAAALSVLTDCDFFGGSDEDLRSARSATSIPVLRKDFIVDSYQIHESRQLGADAILLIVRILDDAQLRDFHALATELGLAVLVETHDATEAERALAAGAQIIGVNARDLDTFEVSLERVFRVKQRISPGCVTVAESGIRDPADVQRLNDAGFDAILVGETLLRSPDPGAKLAALLGGPA